MNSAVPYSTVDTLQGGEDFLSLYYIPATQGKYCSKGEGNKSPGDFVDRGLAAGLPAAQLGLTPLS